MRCEECVNWPPSAMGNKPCCFCYPDTPMNCFQRKGEQKDEVREYLLRRLKCEKKPAGRPAGGGV